MKNFTILFKFYDITSVFFTFFEEKFIIFVIRAI